VTATIYISRELGMTIRASKPVPNKTLPKASQKITFSTNDGIMDPSYIYPASLPETESLYALSKTQAMVHPTTVYREAQVSIISKKLKMPFSPTHESGNY